MNIHVHMERDLGCFQGIGEGLVQSIDAIWKPFSSSCAQN